MNPFLGSAATEWPATPGKVEPIPAGTKDQVMVADRSGTRPTIFLVDWDDTLCASTEWHARNRSTSLDGSVLVREAMEEPEQKHWYALGCWVKLLLIQMLMHSPDGVYIVTNSKEGWVEYSVRYLLPEVAPLLPRLHIISARSSFASAAEDLATDAGNHSEASFIRWKVQAMTSAILRFCRHLEERETKSAKPVVGEDALDRALASAAPFASLLDDSRWDALREAKIPAGGWPDVVALGDSAVDLAALNDTIDQLALANVKSMKFVGQPSLDTLFREIQYVSSLLPALLWASSSFHINLDPAAFAKTKSTSLPSQ